MKYAEIYRLSSQYSPPKVTLRDALILDDYGDESGATLPIDHHSPDDVKREEFDFYGWIYPFVEPEDLLFYLYGMVIQYERDRELECIDSFMYSMDREIRGLQTKLTSAENQILKQALQLIWDIGGEDGADWFHCKQLQTLIGISVWQP